MYSKIFTSNSFFALSNSYRYIRVTSLYQQQFLINQLIICLSKKQFRRTMKTILDTAQKNPSWPKKIKLRNDMKTVLRPVDDVWTCQGFAIFFRPLFEVLFSMQAYSEIWKNQVFFRKLSKFTIFGTVHKVTTVFGKLLSPQTKTKEAFFERCEVFKTPRKIKNSFYTSKDKENVNFTTTLGTLI